VRRDKISDLWPLMAAPERMDADIRKYEEIGTHPAANYLAIAEALTFQQGIGSGNKGARLRYLRDRWATRLLAHERIRLHTSLQEPFACALATVQIDGVDSVDLYKHLWSEHRILTTPIKHDEFEGIRVTPHVYSTLEEVDRFAEAMEGVLRNGLPRS
jgi:selenocysteine lyase/cysteine desulfurase